ncbi:hypothetical protein V0R50_21615 [Pseudomonas sp. 148P]|uniref:Phage-related membrane protein n=1 Tax=Pseudomonas ulcerans TaxID=3115852 RepID=A0ABU7HWJ4_9PSED|nr:MULTISPECIES: hypothetical protein [unclassified Pseudomonas]MEE1924652.1 hypothetical protein [Pseudomonas sp. 147P]MEE1935834.1 hypothetical protein [Pseudomonas sp. 148P]
MAKRIKFSDLLPIYRAMEKASGGGFTLKITNDLLQRSLTQAVDEQNFEESGVTVLQGDYADIKLNDVFLLDVSPPRVGMGILAENFAKYISATAGARVKERDNYYLIEEKFSSADQKTLVVVNRYRQVLRLIRLLADSAHYLDTQKEELIFYKDGRFVVPVTYGETEVNSLDFSGFEKLERFVLDSYHKEQKVKMLAENLIEMLMLTPEKERFPYLIKNINELCQRLQASYNVFASDYTYDKAVAEVHAFKVDAITKVHKAISDIQAQVLGLPIATFIALSQLKVTSSLNAQFAANTAIFFGVLMFCVLLVGFLVNQHATLNTISSEVERQRIVFEKRFDNNQAAYAGELQAVKDRLWWQFFAVYAIAALDLFMLLWCALYYVVHTRPIFNWFF